MCWLSGLSVGQEISLSCGHKVSLVNIFVQDNNGVNLNDSIYIVLKEHKRPVSAIAQSVFFGGARTDYTREGEDRTDCRGL